MGILFYDRTETNVYEAQFVHGQWTIYRLKATDIIYRHGNADPCTISERFRNAFFSA